MWNSLRPTANDSMGSGFPIRKERKKVPLDRQDVWVSHKAWEQGVRNTGEEIFD